MKILLIGCGNIGLPLLKIWALDKACEEIFVVQPSLLHEKSFSEHKHVTFVTSLISVPETFREDIIVVAVKPQQLATVRQELSKRNHNAIIVSTLAGIKLDKLCALWPRHKNIIRIMPNIGIQTGHSINLAFASSSADDHAIKVFKQLFIPSGPIIFVEQEADMDQLTPIAGSGPAYFFLLAELLQQEAMNMGISYELARQIVNQLVVGVASLINDDTDYRDMIKTVTSKKGVTESALHIMEPAIKETLHKSIQAALIRLNELRNENSH